MSNKHYDEASVLRSLDRNPFVRIERSGVFTTIVVTKGAPTVGNGTWGKIDFLCNHCRNYSYGFEVAGAKAAERAAEIAAKKAAKKAEIAEKRAAKLDIVKGAMSKVKRIKK